MTGFMIGATDKEKLAHYLQAKCRQITGDESVTVIWNKDIPANQSGFVHFPATIDFKLEFNKTTNPNACGKSKDVHLGSVLKDLFEQPEYKELRNEYDQGPSQLYHPISIHGQGIKDEGNGRRSIDINCGNATIANHLAKKRDPELYQQAQDNAKQR